MFLLSPSFAIYLALAAPLLLALVSLRRQPPAAMRLRLLGIGTAASALAAVPALTVAWTPGGVTAAQGWLRLDALSGLHLLTVLVVFVPAAFYAGAYFREEIAHGSFSAKLARRFTALWFGALEAMLLVLFSNNLGIMWVGIEATTLLTAFMICTHLTPSALEAMWKYLLMCSVGVAVAFTGILLIAAATAHTGLPETSALLWTRLMDVRRDLDPMLIKAGFLFIVVGFGTKAGLAPMHNWLPDAHSQAPAPVSAIFSGCLLNTALYCILRCLPLAESAGGPGWGREVLLVLGLLSMLVAAGFVMAQRDLKRLLAYSSVEHIGIMALGAGLGGLGTFATMLHMTGHALAKPLAFFCAGSVGQASGTLDMRQMGGVVRRTPVWGAGLILSLLVLIGVAPGLLFVSEWLMLKAALDRHAFWTAGIFLAALALVFIGVLRRAIAIGWDEKALLPPASPQMDTTGTTERLLVAVPLALLLVLGVSLPFGFSDLLRQAALVVAGGQP
jgi:hydrogenase-4 component F